MVRLGCIISGGWSNRRSANGLLAAREGMVREGVIEIKRVCYCERW